MEWLNNPWTIGIGTSVISGLLVFFITRKLFTDKQNREYNQKIKTANNEVLYVIRPLIVEQTKPNHEIINSVFYSTARKHGVELRDIYDKENLCDDLINEIMSNSFLSSEQKMDLTKMITDLKKEEKDEVKEKVITIYKENRRSSSTYTAMLMSLMTAITALVLSVSMNLKDGSLFLDSSDKYSGFIKVLLVAMLIPLTALIMTNVLKTFKEKDSQRREKEKAKEEIIRNIEKEEKLSNIL